MCVILTSHIKLTRKLTDGMRIPGKRQANLAGFLVCAGLMAYALYAQHRLLLDPCPLCVFQRLAVIELGKNGQPEMLAPRNRRMRVRFED